jgi:uncharacterized damage-inducible protein DinB
MPLSASILTRLQHQQETIRELIANLPEQELRRRIKPEKWSAFENIAHLAAYQPLFLRRIRRIQTEDNPFFPRYVAEADPEFPAYCQKTLPWLLEEIHTDRRKIIDSLEGMDEVALERTGLHARYGQFSLSQWADFFLLHEAHHIYTIFMLVQDCRQNLPG